MKYPILTFVFLLVVSASTAQHSTCDGARYKDDVFDFSGIESNVKFGENTTIGGNFQELYMDIYLPAGDMVERRPAIVLAFGGGFLFGSRQDLDGLCKSYAKKGYVVATIDYRLADVSNPDSLQLTEVVLGASNDMRAAIRFLRENALNGNDYRIDPDLIFSGGISAGAITACTAAFTDSSDPIAEWIQTIIEDNGGVEGNSSTNTTVSSEVAGVINFSGALKDADWMDVEDPALFSVHDNGDQVVPFNSGTSSLFPNGVTLEGSNLLHQKAEELALNHELIEVNNNNHVSYFLGIGPVSLTQVVNESAEFLYDIICEGFTSTEELENSLRFRIFPNPAHSELTIQLPEINADYDIIIYNVLGSLVYQERNLNSLRHSIALANLEAGQYFVQIRSELVQSTRRLIIK